MILRRPETAASRLAKPITLLCLNEGYSISFLILHREKIDEQPRNLLVARNYCARIADKWLETNKI